MNKNKKILLDVCCGVCFAGVFEQLNDIYDIVVYWHNANIFPEKEYQKRLTAYQKSYGRMISTIIDNDDWKKNHQTWLKYVDAKNLSSEPEGGKRCIKCYQYRLERVARYAKEHNFNMFASTLTISPHKNAKVINKIGFELEKRYNLGCYSRENGSLLKFYSADFKKKDGFKKANLIAKKLNLYRQNYCGCEFSISK